METMDVCLCNIDFFPEMNSGLSVYCERLARGLSKNHNVTVLTTSRSELPIKESIDNIEVIRLPNSGLDKTGWIEYGYRSARHLEKNRRYTEFDIIHFMDVHFVYHFKRDFIASLHQSFNQRLNGSGGIPYNSGLINMAERLTYYNFAKWMERKALQRATGLMSVSNSTKMDFVNNYDVANEDVSVIYNGIDTDFFSRRDPQMIREKFGIGDEIVLMYAGFSTPRKGVEYLARALDKIGRPFKLMMVGRWENGYREVFYRNTNGHRRNVIEAGYIPENLMPHFYSAADIFILPSLLEGFGFPVAESLSCETPVIATNMGSLPEVVGDCGILVPCKDPKAIASAVNDLEADNRLRQCLGRRGRERVRSMFDIQGMVGNVESYYLNNLC